MGYTVSTNFPIVGTTTAFGGDYDAFVTKIDTSGAELSYSTYLGGSSSDSGYGITVDSAGNAYVTGYTQSANFPIVGTTTALGGYEDAFVTKIGTSGAELSYSTYLGGSSLDGGYGIAVDIAGNAYVTGWTWSHDFPIVGTSTAFGGDYDAFVTKIGTSGAELSYSTYLGGSDWDEGYGIAVDSAGNAYVTGYTQSANFPIVGTTTALGGTRDAFVTKIGTSGAELSYSTYLGGSSYDYGRGITVDSTGNAYVTGDTTSSNFPIVGTTTALGGTRDAFVTKIGTSGAELSYSTYLGGSSLDGGYGIAVDSAGNAYVTGETRSSNFPIVGTSTAYGGGYNDAFVTKIDTSGAELSYSTYLGGSSLDQGYGIAVDSAGNAYVTGYTQSANFPIVGTTTALGGTLDAFVTKIAEPLTEPTPTPSPTPEPTPNPNCKPKKMTIVKDPKQLVQGESGTITVTLTGKKGCISSGYTVTSKVIAGKNKLAISPSSAVTDAGGVTEFTMTAASDKKGIATVRFKTGKLKKDVRVKVKKNG